MKKVGSILSAILLVGTFFIFSQKAIASDKLKVVPSDKVCMVTNMLFPKPQIPVAHAGKTYYGCCENCKKTLSEDPAARTAVDPVSGNPVDKASAVIAARDDGSVIYFESKKNFEAFKAQKRKAN